MQHAVIVAHPSPLSFNLALADAYRKAAGRLGHEVVLRDLYRQGFEPRLAAQELPWADGTAPGADIVAERALIAEAEVFVFVYPLWFNAPPAMLKGYMDRVFGHGFGFAMGAAGNEPALKGRMMFSITTSGAPESWLKQTGSWAAMRKLFDEHFAAVCGLSLIDHLHFGGITPDLDPDAAETCFQTVAERVRANFADA